MPRPPAQEFQDKFVDTPSAAEILDISVPALEQDRCGGALGIPYHKFGSRVRYRLSEVLAWAEARRVVPPIGAERETPSCLLLPDRRRRKRRELEVGSRP